MQVPDIIIAIDGYSSTGKSSFAKLVAKEFGFVYLDSGALYRGVTLYALEHGLIDDDKIDQPALEEALKTLDLHFENHGKGSQLYTGSRNIENKIRTLKVSGKVSLIAAISFVRKYVDGILHAAGANKRVVMDGRDIGTTVFPDAELKIFMTADPTVRAERRLAELREKGEDADFEAVLSNLKERDYMDSHREVSPLTQAPDAVVLDNSNLTFDDQMVWIKNLINERFNGKSC